MRGGMRGVREGGFERMLRCSSLVWMVGGRGLRAGRRRKPRDAVSVDPQRFGVKRVRLYVAVSMLSV